MGLVGVTFVLLLVFTVSGIGVLSSVRGYVLGEGLWSKAQKRAVIALHRYARSGAEEDWVSFEDEIELTLGDRMAREELERPDPDMDVVRRGLAQGDIPEEFHSGMATLFRRFRDVSYVDEAIGIWTEADRQIDRLTGLAAELRGELESEEPDPARIDGLLAAVDEVDRELTGLEDAFAHTLNDGAFQVERALRWVLVGIALIVALGAAATGRFLYRQVRSREEVLERSEARYRMLFEENVVGTVVSTVEGAVVRANAAFARMLGYESPDELIGLHAGNLYASPDDRTGILERLRKKRAVLMDELQARRKDGSPVWLMTSSVLFEDPDDGTEQILATCLDITSRNEMEERLARRSRLEAMGQLAGGIAHDFNNLLAAIQGNVTLLRSRIEGAGLAEADEMISEILASGETAAQLSEQLLAFSRGDPSAAKVVDLGRLVDRTRGLLERLLPENIELITDVAEESMAVQAPPAHLEQIVLNLVINARDAMPAGGRLEIRVDRRSIGTDGDGSLVDLPPGEYVSLQVADEGSGIAPEARERLFEPFFTTKAAQGGTGMGLATVYGIVTRARGSIHVDSTPEEGATFRVLLPLSPHAEEEAQRPDLLEEVEHDGGESILVVEDEDPVRRVVRRILEGAGYHVLEAPDAEAAMVFVKADEPFDLLLTDVVMPGMSGPELARRIADRRPDVPVLFVSGFAEVAMEGEDLAGMTTVSVAKPFSPALLLDEVRGLLDGEG